MEEATSSASAPPLANSDVSPSTPPRPPVDATTELPLPATLMDTFDLDFFGEMDYDMYYASLAQGLLMEPPPPPATAAAEAASAHWDIGDEAADIALWSF
uniref:Uncharacterized protein n=2 Tax=Oryza brachyantha TaxID=4533 RepID=J3MZC1_ORYBR